MTGHTLVAGALTACTRYQGASCTMTYGTIIMNLIVTGVDGDSCGRACGTRMTYCTVTGCTYAGTMIYRCMNTYVKGAMTVATGVWTGVAGGGTNQYTITIMTSRTGVMNFIVAGVGRDGCGATRCTGMTAATLCAQGDRTAVIFNRCVML